MAIPIRDYPPAPCVPYAGKTTHEIAAMKYPLQEPFRNASRRSSSSRGHFESPCIGAPAMDSPIRRGKRLSQMFIDDFSMPERREILKHKAGRRHLSQASLESSNDLKHALLGEPLASVERVHPKKKEFPHVRKTHPDYSSEFEDFKQTWRVGHRPIYSSKSSISPFDYGLPIKRVGTYTGVVNQPAKKISLIPTAKDNLEVQAEAHKQCC